MRRSPLIPSLALCLTSLVVTSVALAEEPPAPAPPAQTAATEDVLELEDGRRLTGELVAEDERLVSFRSGGVLRAYPRSSVRSLTQAERSPAPLPPPIDAPQTKKEAEQAAKAERVAAKQKKKGKQSAKKGAAPAELTADARAWLLALLDRSRSTETTDPAVRSSLAAAIQALGPAAQTDVRAAADASDETTRAFLTKIADRLQAKSDKRAAATGSKRTKRAEASSTTSDEMTSGGSPDGGAAPTKPMSKTNPREKLLGLGMTPEQGREMRDILKEFAVARRDAYMAVRDGSLTRADARTEIDELRTATLETIAGVLDATQYAEFETFAAELFEGRAGRRPGKTQGKKPGKQRQKKDASE